MGSADERLLPAAASAVDETPSYFALEVRDLAEAEALIAHLNRFDLEVRLLLGRTYTQIQRRRLYEPEYKEFADYLKFSSRVQLKPTEIQATMAVYQVFCESLAISPEELKLRRISLGALKTIVRYAQIEGQTEQGVPVLGNADQLRHYLEAAESQHLSVRDLALLIANELDPAAEQSFFKITAVEEIGPHIFATFQEVSTSGILEQGQLRFTRGGFATWVADMRARNRLLLHEGERGLSALPPGSPRFLRSGDGGRSN